MKKSSFTEEQIAFALRQAEAGSTAEENCRKLGISQATFYRWMKTLASMGVSKLRRLTQIKENNQQRKQPVADLSLDEYML